jgi:uncharacterized protein (UPF0276 family)
VPSRTAGPRHLAFENSPLPRPLGIGLTYCASLPPDVYRPELIDFVELTPETLCRKRATDTGWALDLSTEKLKRARAVCGPLPIVVHGVELSIGSASGWNSAYLDMLDRFQAAWPFVWHSEHLSFQTIRADNGTSVDIGVPLPLPLTDEAVRLVSDRAADVMRRYRVPFLLENPAHYLTDLPSDSEIADEFELMTRITDRAGCGQLLDLHNLYCNAINLKFDAVAAIDRIRLDRVLEMHVAGGSWRNGFWMDAHDGPVPEPVWDLLEYVLPRAPNAGGVLFEFLEEHALRIGPDLIADQLARARDIWRRGRASARVDAA